MGSAKNLIRHNNDSNDRPKINWVSSIMFVVTITLGVIVTPIYGWLVDPFDWVEWTAFGLVLIFSGTAITAGYHRLWSHKAYQAGPVLRGWLAFWGAASVQNSILVWSAGHRIHHRHVDDKERDPYSINNGFWFAHMGWMLRNYKSSNLDFSNVNDLKKDAIVMAQHNHYLAFVAASTIVLPLLLGWLNGDALGMFLLAGATRLVLNHQFTFFINSLCHMWGKQPYTNTNTAKDNALLAVVTYGEGYHNFHHYFQSDYRNGVRWWQFDPTKWMIFLASKIGLANNLRRVPEFKIQEAMVKVQLEQAESNLKRNALFAPEAIRSAIEKEYQQFKHTLDTWTQLHGEWMKKQRESLNEKSESVRQRIDNSTFISRFRELEFMLHQQKLRLKQLNRYFVNPHQAA